MLSVPAARLTLALEPKLTEQVVVAAVVQFEDCACCTVDKVCCSRLVRLVRPSVAALMVCEPWPIWSSSELRLLALWVKFCEVK